MAIIDYTTVRRYVENYINDNYTTTPVQFENTSIDVDVVKEFISITDVTGETESMIGSLAILTHGGIIIQIFTELGAGTNRGREIASELANLLNSESFSNFNFTTPQFESFGQVEDADFYQCNLTVPYVYAYGAEEFEVC